MPTLPSAAVPPSESAPFVLTYLCRSYFPGRGLGYSLFIHAIALTIILLFPVVHSPTERFRFPQRATKNNRSEDRVVMYLPSIGGGGQGVGGGLESSGNEPTAAPSSGTEGLIYPGPQVIRSDTPQETNRFQTLLQLELQDLPILNPTFLLNQLPMPEVVLVQQFEPPDLAVGLPDTVKPEEQQPVDPSDGVATEPIQPNLEPQLPTPIDASKPVVPARLPSRERDLQGALAGITIVGGIGGTETSGWGAGSSPSKGALAGITIVGGIGGTETSVNSVPDSRIPHPLQTRYGLYVVSTENSGGGLPSFGVFLNAQIITVYLDMRQKETDAAPFWTLEFAVPRGTAIQANPAGELDESYEGFVLPVPVVKQQPALPLELVRRHIGKMIIVFTVINVEGKMEQISVKESPDPLWNQPVLDALSKWVFRPGVLNGDPVAVEAMLGIPLWSPVPPGQRPRLRRTSLAAKGSRRGR